MPWKISYLRAPEAASIGTSRSFILIERNTNVTAAGMILG